MHKEIKMKYRIKIVSSTYDEKTTYIPQYKFLFTWWNYYDECFDGDIYYEIYKSDIKQEIENFLKLKIKKAKQSIEYETIKQNKRRV